MSTIQATYTDAAGVRGYLRRAVSHPEDSVLLPDDTVDDGRRDAALANAQRQAITLLAGVALAQRYAREGRACGTCA